MDLTFSYIFESVQGKWCRTVAVARLKGNTFVTRVPSHRAFLVPADKMRHA